MKSISAKMGLKLLVVALLLTLSSSTSTEHKDVSDQDKNFITADLNDYIDTIMPNLAEFIATYMDPMPIPDLCEGFSVKPLWITYHGELELTDGSLTGLKTLSRTGDFIVSYLNRLLKIKGDFGFKNIGFTYDYLAKIMNIGPTGGVIGTVSKIGGVCEIMIDFNNNELHLQEFSLQDVGTIRIKLTGNILVDWLSSAVINVITGLFKNIIMKIVESNLKSALQEKIDEINKLISGSSSFSLEEAIPEVLVGHPMFKFEHPMAAKFNAKLFNLK